MARRVLIIPDKFKGTLTAAAAAAAIARGWRRARARDSLSLLPMSDGGDGFGAVTGASRNLSPRGDLKEAAANLFAMLRELDNSAAFIAVSPIPMSGLGEAINDRLQRAAAPRMPS